MPTRTTRSAVTFAHPFILFGIDGVLPAGTYAIDTDETTIDSISFVAWQRLSTVIHLKRDGATQVWPVDPADLEASLQNDTAPTLVARG